MDVKNLRKAIEAINTYYAFAVLLYVAALYVASHSQYFLWLAIAVSPVLAGWTGYLLKSYFDGRDQKHGFRILSYDITYEILGHHAYKVRDHLTIKAEANRMMVYPVGYKWTGEGKVSLPRLDDPNQRILGTIEKYDPQQEMAAVSPYKEVVSGEGDWKYWFVGLSRALYKGETAEIGYVQEFSDSRKKAKTYLNYMVNTSVDKLVLKVRFPADALPSKVSCSYFKLNDRRHAYVARGVVYDPQMQWATWEINKPKYGHSYRIHWEY